MMKVVEPKLKAILEAPTEIDGVCQSKMRNTGILLYIMEMVNRGDSKETIWDVYSMLSKDNSPDLRFYTTTSAEPVFELNRIDNSENEEKKDG